MVLNMKKNDNALRNIQNSANINLLDIDDLIMMKRKQKYLLKHPYAIWQSKDGKYWYTTFPDKTKPRGVRQVRRNSEIELQQAIIDYWESESDKLTIEEIFIEWNDRKLELKKISSSTHLRNEQIYKKHFSDISQRYIEDFDANDFADFLEEQIAKYSLTSKAFSNLKGIVKGIVKWARKKSIINYNDYDVIAMLDISEKSFKKTIKEDEEEVFTPSEVSVLYEYICSNQDLKNLAILLIFVTGLRVGELVALKHHDFVDNAIKVRRTEIRVPKDNGGSTYEVREFPKSEAGVRDVVIPSEYQWLINKICKGNIDNYVFLNERQERLTTNTIRRRLSTICKKNGIKPKSPHKIRKTYGSILLDNNVDKKFVIDQMGHSDVHCTETYYHYNRRDKKEKSKILDRIPDFKHN